MGIAASCAPSIISIGVVKVFVFCEERMEIYTKPLKVAELMLENPGQFICDSKNLKVGQRVPGLSADYELERRQLYFVLPMEMLYSVLTNEEMTSLTYRASKALKHKNFGRIFPVIGDFCMFPSEAKKPVERVQRRYSRQRSWIPALETITEAPSRIS